MCHAKVMWQTDRMEIRVTRTGITLPCVCSGFLYGSISLRTVAIALAICILGIALHAFFGMDDIARAGGNSSATRSKVASGNSEQNIGTIINHKPQKLTSISGHVVTIRGLSIASSVSNGITTSSLSAGFNRIHRVRKPSLSWLRALSEEDDSSG